VQPQTPHPVSHIPHPACRPSLQLARRIEHTCDTQVHAPKQITQGYYKAALHAASMHAEEDVAASALLADACPWSATRDGHGSFPCTPQPKFSAFDKGAGGNCACNRLLTVAMIRALDDSVSNLTHAFQDAGLWQNSVMIFMGGE
jgi:hypothetical protein